jgi:hypothetical protein
LTVDSLGSQEAVAGGSEVTVDASASTGNGLRYLVSFGDGATAADVVARHVYGVAGTYTRDADDHRREQSCQRNGDARARRRLAGWRVAVQRLSRAGGAVEVHSPSPRRTASACAALTRVGGRDSTVTGTLTPDRQIRVAVDGGSEGALEGRLPSVTGDGVTWPAAARGGVADGETLIFRRRSGEPSGPPPHAIFAMRFFSFSAPYAIKRDQPGPSSTRRPRKGTASPTTSSSAIASSPRTPRPSIPREGRIVPGAADRRRSLQGDRRRVEAVPVRDAGRE